MFHLISYLDAHDERLRHRRLNSERAETYHSLVSHTDIVSALGFLITNTNNNNMLVVTSKSA